MSADAGNAGYTLRVVTSTGEVVEGSLVKHSKTWLNLELTGIGGNEVLIAGRYIVLIEIQFD